MDTFDVNEASVLHRLHCDIWSEELLSEQFAFIVDNILTKRQKLILELKVEGYTNNEIERYTKIKLTTLDRQIKSIKSKFRNKMELRVDNLNLQWMNQNYGKTTKKKKKKK